MNVPVEIKNKLFQIGATFLLFLIYFIARVIILRLVKRRAQKNSIEFSRELHIKKLSNYLLFIMVMVLIAGVWEISFKGLSLGFASAFTVIGVALFAHWSILSNLTASIILYFFFPYKIGGKISIIEGNTVISGTILDITLFYIKIRTDQKKEISIPNNLAFQKIIEYQ
ncbi:MAG: mechanosensitive ion channel family protein [Cyclobacteriaceae bacterium]|nr:mechanosensitive ion channel family protein [Cyclobacteriaceae bacterium]